VFTELVLTRRGCAHTGSQIQAAHCAAPDEQRFVRSPSRATSESQCGGECQHLVDLTSAFMSWLVEDPRGCNDELCQCATSFLVQALSVFYQTAAVAHRRFDTAATNGARNQFGKELGALQCCGACLMRFQLDSAALRRDCGLSINETASNTIVPIGRMQSPSTPNGIPMN